MYGEVHDCLSQMCVKCRMATTSWPRSVFSVVIMNCINFSIDLRGVLCKGMLVSLSANDCAQCRGPFGDNAILSDQDRRELSQYAITSSLLAQP